MLSQVEHPASAVIARAIAVLRKPFDCIKTSSFCSVAVYRLTRTPGTALRLRPCDSPNNTNGRRSDTPDGGQSCCRTTLVDWVTKGCASVLQPHTRLADNACVLGGAES